MTPPAPLRPGDVGLLALYLDAIPEGHPVSSAMARRLLATLRQAERERDAAWALLAASSTPASKDR